MAVTQEDGGREPSPSSSRQGAPWPWGCRGAGQDPAAPACFPGGQTLPRASPNCRMWALVCRQLRRHPASLSQEEPHNRGQLPVCSQAASTLSQPAAPQLLQGSATTELPALGCRERAMGATLTTHWEGEVLGAPDRGRTSRTTVNSIRIALKKIILMF